MTPAVAGLPWLAILGVGLGAALGAWLRWSLALLLNRIHPAVPAGTLVANLVGGLLVGAALAWFARHPDIAPAWRLAAMTGFLGGFTTFSAFSLESLLLLQKGQWAWAAAHSALHVFGSLAAAALGYRLASA